MPTVDERLILETKLKMLYNQRRRLNELRAELDAMYDENWKMDNELADKLFEVKP